MPPCRRKQSWHYRKDCSLTYVTYFEKCQPAHGVRGMHTCSKTHTHTHTIEFEHKSQKTKKTKKTKTNRQKTKYLTFSSLSTIRSLRRNRLIFERTPGFIERHLFLAGTYLTIYKLICLLYEQKQASRLEQTLLEP